MVQTTFSKPTMASFAVEFDAAIERTVEYLHSCKSFKASAYKECVRDGLIPFFARLPPVKDKELVADILYSRIWVRGYDRDVLPNSIDEGIRTGIMCVLNGANVG